MPEPRGSRALVYGDLGFGRLWGLIDAADIRTDL